MITDRGTVKELRAGRVAADDREGDEPEPSRLALGQPSQDGADHQSSPQEHLNHADVFEKLNPAT